MMKQESELSLKKYAVCYFDVLGTKKRINTDINGALKNLYAISTAISKPIYIEDTAGKNKGKSNKTIVRAFTDNFLIAKEIEEKDSFSQINTVFMCVGQAIIKSLFENGILLRGAVTVGNMHIDDVTILGPALLDAYRIEADSCIYPRIIADQSVLDLIPGAATPTREFNTYFFKDYDGAICFNYLLFVVPDYFERNVGNLIQTLENDRDNSELKEKLKFDWMINYLKDFDESQKHNIWSPRNIQKRAKGKNEQQN